VSLLKKNLHRSESQQSRGKTAAASCGRDDEVLAAVKSSYSPRCVHSIYTEDDDVDREMVASCATLAPHRGSSSSSSSSGGGGGVY